MLPLRPGSGAAGAALVTSRAQTDRHRPLHRQQVRLGHVCHVDPPVQVLVGLNDRVGVGSAYLVLVVALGQGPRGPQDDDGQAVLGGDELAHVLAGGLGDAVDVPGPRRQAHTRLASIPASPATAPSRPQVLTQAEQVRLIGEAIGRAVRWEEPDPQAARQRLLTAWAAFVATALASWAGLVTEPEPVNRTVERLTGVPARMLGQ
jgi:hypothetical protein